MKSLLIVFGFILFAISIQAQEQYTVDGETYTLKTDVDGDITLLWNTIDRKYRYFLKNDNGIVELKNTKQDGRYQEEYKETLQNQTAGSNISTDEVKLTLASLHSFFVEYNTFKNPSFNDTNTSPKLKFRVGGFVGVTNSVYTQNTFNKAQGQAGLELEMIDAVKLKRHALVLRYKQTISGNSYKYSASQFSLNYRFKFIKTPKFDVFANAKFAALTFFKFEQTQEYEIAPPVTTTASGSDFSAPITFGIGADYKVGNGYITFNYDDIVGLNVNSNNEFPIDFSLGYKFNL